MIVLTHQSIIHITEDGEGNPKPRYKLEVCPLFAALPQEQQLKAFRPVKDPATTRKVPNRINSSGGVGAGLDRLRQPAQTKINTTYHHRRNP